MAADHRWGEGGAATRALECVGSILDLKAAAAPRARALMMVCGFGARLVDAEGAGHVRYDRPGHVCQVVLWTANTADRATGMEQPEAPAGRDWWTESTTRRRQRFLTVPQFRVGTANANIDVLWSGNAYGEITSVIFERVLAQSSEWTKSDLHITVNALSRIPVSRDPREWPITFRYQGTYDPMGNGYVEFQGEIEVNAFGGLRWISPHQAVSRSLADWALSGRPEDWVRRGPEVWPATPTIPAEQAAFLRQNLPG